MPGANRLCLKLFAAAAIMLTAVRVFAGDGHGTLSAEASSDGIKIGNALFDISIFSKVIVCEPPWKTMRFYTMKSPLEFTNTAQTAAIATEPTADFRLDEYSVKLNGDSGIVTLNMSLTADLPTFMEYTMFTLPDYLLADAKFTAADIDGKKVSGEVPQQYSGKSEIRYLVRNAKSFSAVNNLGTFSFEVETGPGFTVADRRGVPFENKSCYWIGCDGDMKPDTPVVSVVKFSFKLNPELKPAPVLPAAGTTHPTAIPDIFATAKFAVPQLPVPHEVVRRDTAAAIAAQRPVIDAGLAPEDAGKLSRAAARLFPAPLSADARPLNIVIGPDDRLPAPPDSYLLDISPDRARITAATARGAFYALQTMRTFRNPDGTFQCVEVRDWPDMPIRGIHLAHMDNHALENYAPVIENIMAPMKMNFLLLECEFVEWDALKGLHVRNSMPKRDLIELLKVADDNFIEAAPLIQTLGHTPWLFFGGKNLDLCEDPDYPYAFFTSNPRLYPLLEELFAEVTDTFNHPRYFHIGADETFLFGRFPNRPESVEKGSKQIIGDFVLWCHDYFTRRGITMMMWQDIFSTPQESPENGAGGPPHNTVELRKTLPHDIIFTVWRYSGDYEEFGDLNAVAADGFPVIGCSWFAPNNPENLTREARKVNALGMLSTTWIYSSDDQSSRHVSKKSNNWFAPPDAPFFYWFHQLAAYIRSGAFSWNETGAAAASIDAAKAFSTFYAAARRPEVRAGSLIDLSDAANIEISAAANPFVFQSVYGLDNLPDDITAGDVKFRLMTRNGKRAAIAVKSRNNPAFPESAGPVSLNGLTAAKLYFLHTTAGTTPEKYDIAATVAVKYEDGTAEEIPMRYAMEVGAPRLNFNYYLGVQNVLQTPDGRIWFATWKNPHPEKPIAALEVLSGMAPYYLFGVSAE
ncbi:MAG: glycoside hydrolase family 20 zincin-like fold domain-containing protein [Victivallaceae bacterium]|nr:glycoside hydrolase family 20 zincin-like fold domain-containing protein [Victivallaceae bacterium]